MKNIYEVEICSQKLKGVCFWDFNKILFGKIWWNENYVNGNFGWDWDVMKIEK